MIISNNTLQFAEIETKKKLIAEHLRPCALAAPTAKGISDIEYSATSSNGADIETVTIFYRNGGSFAINVSGKTAARIAEITLYYILRRQR